LFVGNYLKGTLGEILEKSKKLKAAIMGVLYFLQERGKNNNNRKTNHWVRLGRELIMRNRYLVQRRTIKR